MSTYKNVVILGGGESGIGAAILAKKQGLVVFLSDFGVIADDNKFLLKSNAIDFEEKNHDYDKILRADFVIKSPGIPENTEVIQRIRISGIPIMSEIEFASRYTTSKIIAITGSNGKTTTTSLIYHILKTADYDVAVGGNIGISFAKNIADRDPKYHVIEVSSFQLDDITRFRPDVAVLLNITPDHLDRYDNLFEKYVNSKCAITTNQGPYDVFVYNATDKAIVNWLNGNSTNAELFPISLQKEKNEISVDGIDFSIEKIQLKGSHNLFNMSCAIKAALAVGVKQSIIQEAIETFSGVAHRMELVAEIDGVEYINDSKATNVDAVLKAMKSMDKGVVWIVGGKDKGNNYEELKKIVKKKVKAIICLGKDNSKLLEEFSGMVKDIADCDNMECAVAKANEWAQKKNTVLLSPACASFDLFKNYEDRGDQFKSEVKKLIKK